MILSAIAEKLKRRSKDDFKGRHFEASLILESIRICGVLATGWAISDKLTG